MHIFAQVYDRVKAWMENLAAIYMVEDVIESVDDKSKMDYIRNGGGIQRFKRPSGH